MLPSAQGGSEKKKSLGKAGRVRATKACDLCSKLRQKCSGEQPCSSCFSKNRECLYTRKVARRGPPKLDTLLAAKRMLEEQLLLRSTLQNSSVGFETFGSSSVAGSLPLLADEASFQSQHLECSPLTASSSSSTLARSYTSADLLLGDVVDKNQKTTSYIPGPSSICMLRQTDFCFLLVWDQNNWIYFLEYYFKHMYASFPFLDQEWILANLQDIPIYYFHAMYACTLIFASTSNQTLPSMIGIETQEPSQKAASLGDAAHMHYKEALKLILDNLEQADTFMVAALYHLFSFALASSFISDQIAVTHYELAIGLAHILQLWKSDSLLGNNHSPSEGKAEEALQNNPVCNSRFSLGVWFAVQIMDVRLSFIFCEPSRLSSRYIDLQSIGHFYMYQAHALSLNATPPPLVAPTHHHHDLALIDYSLPLINLLKKVQSFRESFDLSLNDPSVENSLLLQAFALKYDLDRWFGSIPPGIQIWPGQFIWKGAQVMELNCIYHVASIFLFVSQSNSCSLAAAPPYESFLSHSAAYPPDLFSHQSPASLCLSSANLILVMSQSLNQHFSSYLSISSSAASSHIPLPTLLFLQYALFIASLTMCAFNPDTHQVRIHVEYHLLYALKICGASCAFVEGPLTRESTTFDADLIRSCIGYPERAIHVLRQRMVL